MPSATPATVETTVSTSVKISALQQHVPVGQQFGELQCVAHARRAPRVALRSPAASGAFSHFSDILSSSPDALALAMISLTLAQQLRLVLVEADEAGAVLEHELERRRAGRALLGDRGGHRVAGGDQVDLAGDEGGDGGVVVLEALDGRVAAARSWSAPAPRSRRGWRRSSCRPRSSALGDRDRPWRRTRRRRTARRRSVKSITFSRSGFLPRLEITRSAFLVCR